ncbi:MAG: SGNH/GDSL hydrolase family protein [Vicinamibacteria bacterium]
MAPPFGSRARRFLGTMALFLSSSLGALVLAEVVSRGLELGSTEHKERPIDDENPPWGWRGVRRFGDENTLRPRLMVLGDSFTAGRGIGRRPDYATLLGKSLGVEVFSYGGEGYSTAQELMVLRRFAPRIRPDVVLLQMSSNDFINNSEELEAASFLNNNLKVRPYLEDGRMVLRYPRLGAFVRARTVGFSAFSRQLFYALDRARAYLATKGYLHSVEEAIRGNPRHPAFLRAVATTRELLRQFRDDTGPGRLLAFPSDGMGEDKVFLDSMRAIGSDLEIPFFDSLPQGISALDTPGDSVFLPNDPHWSERGHRIAAALLTPWIQTRLAGRDAAPGSGIRPR